MSVRYFRGDREIPIPFAVFFIILTTWQRASANTDDQEVAFSTGLQANDARVLVNLLTEDHNGGLDYLLKRSVAELGGALKGDMWLHFF